jgi:hypothetical protein
LAEGKIIPRVRTNLFHTSYNKIILSSVNDWSSLKRIRKKDPFHLELGSTTDISIMIKPTKDSSDP